MLIIDHILEGANVEASPNQGQPFNMDTLDTIILHYTASSSSESTIKTMTDPSTRVSAHILIGRDSSITQFVPFNVQAKHAGESRFNRRTDLNKYSLGIEIENAGKLKMVKGSFIAWFGLDYDSSEVVEIINWRGIEKTYWHKYDSSQINQVIAVCANLAHHYNIRHILGHDAVSPDRKIDPGPAFPWTKFEDALRESLFHPQILRS